MARKRSADEIAMVNRVVYDEMAIPALRELLVQLEVDGKRSVEER